MAANFVASMAYLTPSTTQNGGFSPLFQAVACVSYCASRDSSVGMFEGSSRAVAIFCDR